MKREKGPTGGEATLFCATAPSNTAELAYGVLTRCAEPKKKRPLRDALFLIFNDLVVAGVGFEPTTFRL